MDGDPALKHAVHSLGVRVKINQTVLPKGCSDADLADSTDVTHFLTLQNARHHCRRSVGYDQCCDHTSSTHSYFDI
jgi:hypothetical protein